MRKHLVTGLLAVSYLGMHASLWPAYALSVAIGRKSNDDHLLLFVPALCFFMLGMGASALEDK